MMIRGIFLIICSAIFFSCENSIDIEIPQVESTLVVEGWIEQGKGANILLSMSAPFFTQIDSSTLRQFAVTTAKVTIFSGNETEIAPSGNRHCRW